jgi:hypothetical protein
MNPAKKSSARKYPPHQPNLYQIGGNDLSLINLEEEFYILVLSSSPASTFVPRPPHPPAPGADEPSPWWAIEAERARRGLVSHPPEVK